MLGQVCQVLTTPKSYPGPQQCCRQSTQGDWLKFGFMLSIFYLAVWLGVGGMWWKVIGLW